MEQSAGCLTDFKEGLLLEGGDKFFNSGFGGQVDTKSSNKQGTVSISN